MKIAFIKHALAACLLALLPFFPAWGQESGSPINYQGKDITSLKHAWSAQWVTHPTASTLDYNVFLYRRNFNLQAVPETFVVHLSADNRYRFYVNGKYVCDGPSRGDINHWRYETVDVAGYLQTGKNTFAAEVVNFGEFRHAAQQTFQTAFILQGPKGAKPNLNTGANTDWKVALNEAYNFIPFVSDSVGGYYAAGPGDRVDGRQYPWGWNEAGFDDSDFLKTRPATVEFAVGRGFLFGSTWYLVPRQIPFMKEETVRFDRVVASHSTMDGSSLLIKNKPLTVPPNSRVSILLDNGTHTIGYPEMTVSKGRGASIKATYAEALFYKNSKERVAHKGWEKGLRNELEGKEIRGIYDIFIADGGEKRLFKPLAMRTYRFVQLDIETKNEPLVINDYHGVYTGYPFEEIGQFTSDDPLLDEIWTTSWRTLKNSSTEIFIDPYYEQLQYVGDARVESLISIYVTGDDRLMRKAIQSFDASRLPNGLTQSRFPSYIVQVIPTYSLLWTDMIHDYYMYRDDPEFLRQFLPGMESVLSWFGRKVDGTGMLADLDWWNFTDWTAGFQNGIPPGADDGHSANVSMQYLLALKNAAEIFSFFGENEKAEQYQKQALELQFAIFKNCFDKEKGLVAERPEKDVFSQHANIFALLADAFPIAQQKEVMQKILTDTSLIQCSVYFRFYLARALQKTGMADQYLSMLGPWKNMLAMGMTTFGETDLEPRSDCHAWSASPCFDFLHTVAGIQPSSPGFATVLIAPNFGHLHKIKADFPHPKGVVKMDLQKTGAGVFGEIILPDGLSGSFVFNDKKMELKAGKNRVKVK
ncbi:MAG TPA: alpha-L-rhamnosidase [Bacteroidetes bacterium]|nr:alpha-L-rhamnosidase [Bacteroidota bacterium]